MMVPCVELAPPHTRARPHREQNCRYFTKGVADHIPTDCLNVYPEVVAYMERMLAVPEIKEWYSKH